MAKETGAVWALIQEWMDAMPYGSVSQRQLAAMAQVSHTTITDWKYKRALPAVDKMQTLAGILRLPEERVLFAFMEDHGYGVMLPQHRRR